MSDLKRILYVEDEPDIQAIAKLALEVVGGLELKVCSSGEEALECAESFAPDLFLLDVMMPGLNGPDTLRALQDIPSVAGLPAIFMTAKVQPAEVTTYKALGAIDVIAKPFDPMTLSDQIKEIWNNR